MSRPSTSTLVRLVCASAALAALLGAQPAEATPRRWLARTLRRRPAVQKPKTIEAKPIEVLVKDLVSTRYDLEQADLITGSHQGRAPRVYRRPGDKALAVIPEDLPLLAHWYAEGKRGGKALLVDASVAGRVADKSAIKALDVRIWPDGQKVTSGTLATLGQKWRTARGAPEAPDKTAKNVLAYKPRELELTRLREVGAREKPTLFVHANKRSLGYYIGSESKDVSVSELAAFLQSKGYRGGELELAACYSGCRADGPAQALANQLGLTLDNVSIKAPTDRLFIAPDGGYHVENGGSWRTFTPNK